ncbi:PqiC family protein [Pseudoalteromonas sp. T1lg23B]|uniref:PqiC family protein n=1 Tax=Pseudoalteromonas sp. T1lg23B TaxID=2077097 RepID=UPI000CF5F7FF|nr:PqiC family protein [Pseudoalteromonas sp. T1lg23B]
MRYFGSCFFILLLSACSNPTSQTSQYYGFSLDLSQQQRAEASQPAHTLKVNTVKMSGTADQQGIVQRLDDNKVSVAQYHFWAEHPRYMLTRSLTQALTRDLSQWQILNADVPTTPANSYVLSIVVDDFAGHYKAGSLVSGRWFVYTHRNGDTELLIHRPFTLTEPLKENGFSPLVQALQVSWLKLSADISSQLATITQNPDGTN